MLDALECTTPQVLLKNSRVVDGSLDYNNMAGMSASYFVSVRYKGRKSTRVFAKVDELGIARREVAAYHVARLSGLVDVAPCTIQNLKWLGKDIHTTKPKHVVLVEMMWPKEYKEIGHGYPSSKFGQRLRLFDHLIVNSDRHSGNMMFKKWARRKHEVAIDHGLCFNYDRLGSYQVTAINYAYIERLRADWLILELLEQLLTPSNFKDFVGRLQRIKVIKKRSR
jgi:hypothetical protein